MCHTIAEFYKTALIAQQDLGKQTEQVWVVRTAISAAAGSDISNGDSLIFTKRKQLQQGITDF